MTGDSYFAQNSASELGDDDSRDALSTGARMRELTGVELMFARHVCLAHHGRDDWFDDGDACEKCRADIVRLVDAPTPSVVGREKVEGLAERFERATENLDADLKELDKAERVGPEFWQKRITL